MYKVSPGLGRIEGFGQEEQPKPILLFKPTLMGRAGLISPERAAELKAQREAEQAAAAAAEQAALIAAMEAAAAEEQKGLPTWAWALIGVGGASVVLAAMYFLVFKKKGKGEAGEVVAAEEEVATESLPPTAADTLMTEAATSRW